jgi:DNA repair exonuclease SbcCD nuclease subunit
MPSGTPGSVPRRSINTMVGLFREGAVEANISLVLHLKEVGLPVVMISGSHDAMERAEENNLQLLRKRFHAQELYDAVNTALSSGEFGQRGA